MRPKGVMLKVSMLTMGMALATPTWADDQVYGSATVTAVTSVYDGDTFRVNIPNWPPIIGSRIPIRLKSVNTPEMRGNCAAEKRRARKAKQRTAELLRNADHIELQQIERDKYFRLDADVYVDGRQLGAVLLREGLARRYDGGRRKSWC